MTCSDISIEMKFEPERGKEGEGGIHDDSVFTKTSGGLI